MKGASIIILSCVVAAAVIYGLGAFITWEVNPENWGATARLWAISCWAIICWLFGSYIA